MNSTNRTTAINDTYALFESHIREGFKLLKIKPLSIVAEIKYVDLPIPSTPLEELELEVEFPGATCLIHFAQSTVDTYIFFSLVEFNRQGQRSLSLDNYLAARKDQRKEYLSFKDTEFTLEEGISRIVKVLVELFNNDKLYNLLAGLTWITAPVDWEGYK